MQPHASKLFVPAALVDPGSCAKAKHNVKLGINPDHLNHPQNFNHTHCKSLHTNKNPIHSQHQTLSAKYLRTQRTAR